MGKPSTTALLLSIFPLLVATPSRADPELDYYAPKVSASLVMTLTLKSCTDTSHGGIIATGTVAVTSKAVRDETRHAYLDGATLRSLTKKKDVTINLTDDLTLKSVNATIEDRTGAIVVGVLKFVAGLVALGAGADRSAVTTTPCNDTTTAVLKAHDAMVAALAKDRVQLASLAPDKVEAMVKAMDSLSMSIAGLETGPLALTLTKALPIDRANMTGQQVSWTLGDVTKWFGKDLPGGSCRAVDGGLFGMPAAKQTACEAPTNLFSVKYTIKDGDNNFTPGQTNTDCFGTTVNAHPECHAGLVFIIPALATIEVTSASSNLEGTGNGDPIGKADLVVPQWGQANLVPFKVGFAENKTLALTFNQFGQITQFGSKSDARLENAVGTANDAVAAITTGVTSVQGAGVAKWKSDIDALETEEKWNALNACRAAIERGATSCAAAPAQ